MTDEETRLHHLDLVERELHRVRCDLKRLTDAVHIILVGVRGMN